MAFFANGSASVAGGVAIVSKDAKAIVEALGRVVKLGELVLCQGFGGEEVQSAVVRVFKAGVQNRQVVAKGFSGSGWRNDDDILSGVDCFRCRRLMGGQAANAFGGVGGSKVGMPPSGEVRPLRLARRKMAHGGEEFAVRVAGGKGLESFLDAGDGCWQGGPADG